MMIKMTLQGGLIYLTLTLFVATAVSLRGGWRNIGRGFWGAGFVAAVASLAWRGMHTGHPPMQNLFEFFLCMAAALWPLSQWSRWKNRTDTDIQDALLGALILIPAGFVFGEEVRRLPPALQSPLFIPHVASYVAGYVMLARAALMALPLMQVSDSMALAGTKAGPGALAGQPLMQVSDDEALVRKADAASRQTAAAGFVLLTLGLLLGSLWGKICWGHYWQWDPKEMWSLATWLLYGGYFHYRLKNGVHSPKTLAVLLWLGLLFVVLTLTWINVSRLFSGMHNYA